MRGGAIDHFESGQFLAASYQEFADYTCSLKLFLLSFANYLTVKFNIGIT